MTKDIQTILDAFIASPWKDKAKDPRKNKTYFCLMQVRLKQNMKGITDPMTLLSYEKTSLGYNHAVGHHGPPHLLPMLRLLNTT